MSDHRVNYRPARTVAAVTGTVTVATEADGHQQTTRTSSVSISAHADVRDRWTVVLMEKHFGRDRQFDLKFGDDERLTGTTYTSTGVGGKLIEAGLRVATLAASVIPAVMTAGPELDAKFASDHPELADRRNKYKRTIAALEAAFLNAAQQAATDGPPADLDTHLQVIQDALTTAAATAATIETQFEQWLAANFPPWERSYSFLLGTDELPTLDNAPEQHNFGPLAPAVAMVADALGIVIARVDDKRRTETAQPTDTSAIWFRVPRAISLAVYEIVNPADTTSGYRLKNIMPAWIVDRFSDIESVAIESHLFHSDGATLGFGEAGTLTHLANKETSAAGELATTLSGAGAAIGNSIDQGAKIAGFLTPGDPEVQSLQKQVARKELQARLVRANKTIAGAPSDKSS